MKLDVSTIIFITSLIFLTQTVAVFVQYRVNKNYSGPGWWLAGTFLQATGFSLMLMLHFKSIFMLAIFANPLIFLGQLLLVIGIIRFLEKKEKVRFYISLFLVYVIIYYSFMFIQNSIFVRTLIIFTSSALISFMAGYTIFKGKMRSFSTSAVFTASVFFIYGCCEIAVVVITILLPSITSHHELSQEPLRLFAFIVPISGSMLWTFGFIIMVNQRLNSENIEEKEQLKMIFNMSPDAKSIIRMSDTVLADVNAGFLAQTGYTRDELIGSPARFPDMWVNKDDLRCFIAGLDAAGSFDNMETVFKRKNRSLFSGVISGRIISINDQAHAVTVINDITQSKRSEQEIRDLLAAKEFQYDRLVKTREELIAANAELEKISVQDKLTGLFNRRKLADVLDHEILRLNRFGGDGSLIMADIDHFKRINDEHGHITGDEVLVRVASILQENIRDLDFCFRWGGEEFIMLLTGTEFEGAMIFAEKIRKAIESCTSFTAVPVTVSIGVSSYREGWN